MYIDRGYKPNQDIVCTFYIEPATGEAMAAVAAESSIGTWTGVPKTKRRLAAKVFDWNKKGFVKIAYPMELFEKGNVPQLLSSVAGNIFGMKAVRNLRLEDIEFPASYAKSFQGPQYGVEKIRSMLKIKRRPVVGTIVKPKLGLTSKEHAKASYEAWVGGLDVVKDDENLTSQSFNPFARRVTETLKMKKKAEHETGEHKIYLPNVTAETCEMLKRIKFVEQSGGNYIMVDMLTIGFAALQTMRNSTRLPIHAHRAMHAAMTKGRHGVSMLVLCRLARLIGVDSLHIGTAAIGKMKQDDEASCLEQALLCKWHAMKRTFPVASGGLHPLLVPRVVQAMGSDVFIMFGGGCHGHPGGSRSGAAAIRQAVDAVVQGVPLKKYAARHPELRQAIDKWGGKAAEKSKDDRHKNMEEFLRKNRDIFKKMARKL